MGNHNKLPDMLRKEELIKLFEAIDRPKCSIACFMALICGLRVNEVCTLRISDIDLERKTVKIRDGKNPNRKKQGYGKDRISPIPEFATSPIKKWLDIVQGGKWFLPSAKSPDLHLRKKTLHEWFRQARKRAGLDYVEYTVEYKKPTKYRKTSPVYRFRFHHLRHFFATYVYEKTGDIYAVADLLGHNQVTTTQIYARMSNKKKRDVVNFAFNNPVRTQMFERNPINALNYSIPEVSKRDKPPIEILNERYAKGEISEFDYINKLKLLKQGKEIMGKINYE